MGHVAVIHPRHAARFVGQHRLMEVHSLSVSSQRMVRRLQMGLESRLGSQAQLVAMSPKPTYYAHFECCSSWPKNEPACAGIPRGAPLRDR
jgi:hypothetical protein